MSKMTRRQYIRTLLGYASVAALSNLGCEGRQSREQRRPNFVFILIDDLGYKDVGFMGSKYYETPNIDRLAKQGMVFTNAYANAPNCAPTRACILSGQYTPRHGVYTVGTSERGPAALRKLIPIPNRTTLPREVVTIAEALKPAGYVSASIGKWHLGSDPEFGPRAQGFDVNVAGNAAGSPRSYFSPYRNKDLPDGPKGEYLTDRLTDEALKFIEANKSKPFFLYLPHYAVHTPLRGKQELVEKYRQKPPADGQRNPVYAAMIESVDQSVGRIMAKLDELGLAENTVVVFFSDNGGVGGYRELGIMQNEITSNAPLRGGKGMLYEGGIREPMVVRWPAAVKPGTVCHEPVIGIDFYPTFLEIAGVDPPAGHVLDGESLVPLLKQTGKLKREAIFWHFPAYLQARNGTWRTTPAGVIRQGDFKLIEFFEDGTLELYNLSEDIGEKNNLAQKMPDKVRELHERLVRWREEIGAPVPTERNPKYNPAGARGGRRRGKQS